MGQILFDITLLAVRQYQLKIQQKLANPFNVLKIYLLITLCILPLYSCSTSNNTKLFTPIKTKADMATVYIYRPSAMANAIYSPELYINGELNFNLKIGEKYILNLLPEEYTFEIEPDKKYSGTTRLTLSLKANNLYYLRLDASLKIKNSLAYENYQRGFSLINIDDAQAIKEITKCCTQVNKGIADNNKSEKSSNEGFSTDKTHNPFAH